MTSLTSVGVASYARAVRAALRDLSPEQSHTILDGLDEHLAEIVAEGASDLEAVLGPPSAYADELRASAGLPTVGEPLLEGDADDAAPADVFAPHDVSTEPMADVADDDVRSDADRVGPIWARRLGADRRVATARIVLIAVLGVLAIITIRASEPISAWQVVLGGVIIGAAWMGLRTVVRRAALAEPWAARAPIGLAGAAVVFALLLGGWLADSGTEYVYVDADAPIQTAPFSPFQPDVMVQLPDVTGLRYQDAMQVLANAGLGVRVDGDSANLSIDTIVVGTSPGPGFGVASGSVITLLMDGQVTESTNLANVNSLPDVSTTLAPAATTPPTVPHTTDAAQPSTPQPTTTMADTTLPSTTLPASSTTPAAG